MKNYRTIAYLLLPLCVCSSASADVYFRASAIYADVDDVTSSAGVSAAVDNSAGLSGALGYQFTIARVELETLWLESDFEGLNVAGSAEGSLDHVDVFVNAMVDIPVIPVVTPYVGAGAGIGFVDFDGNVEIADIDAFSYSEREDLFGYQFIVGLRADIPATDLSAYVSYRYVVFEDLEAQLDTPGTPILETGDSNIFEIGAMLYF